MVTEHKSARRLPEKLTSDLRQLLRWSIALTVVCSILGATACYGAIAAGSVGSSAKLLKRGRAEALVQAVILRKQDMPGFRGAATAHKTSHEENGKEFAQCAGADSPARDIAKAHSQTFQRESHAYFEAVGSGVSVESSAKLADEELAEVRSTRVQACLSKFLNARIPAKKTPGESIGTAVVSPEQVTVSGVTGAFGWRITIPFEVRNFKYYVWTDIVGFVEGPVEVTLTTSSVPKPFPSSIESHLLNLLARRVHEHL